MAGDEAVKSAPIIEYGLHLFHKIRMMRRPEACKQGLADVRCKLVAQEDNQRDGQNDKQ